MLMERWPFQGNLFKYLNQRNQSQCIVLEIWCVLHEFVWYVQGLDRATLKCKEHWILFSWGTSICL